MIVYRKLRCGRWGLCGPASEMRLGIVTVTKKDGSTKEESVCRLGEVFDVDGVPHRFGFLPHKADGTAKRGPVPRVDGKSAGW